MYTKEFYPHYFHINVIKGNTAPLTDMQMGNKMTTIFEFNKIHVSIIYNAGPAVDLRWLYSEMLQTIPLSSWIWWKMQLQEEGNRSVPTLQTQSYTK